MKTLPTMKLIGLFTLALASGNASAQSGGPFTLNWNTIDGGGGNCSGGVTPAGGTKFALSGTVGQPDAGVMNGGAYSLAGGFWGGLSDIPSSGPPPALAIRRGAGNTVVLSWPNPSTGYVLQQTANMNGSGGGWADVNATPVVVGPNKEVTLAATGSSCAFRLRH